MGRFLSVDPLTSGYPWYTPYQYAGNSPILFVDIDGLEAGKDLNYNTDPALVVQRDKLGVIGTAEDKVMKKAFEDGKTTGIALGGGIIGGLVLMVEGAAGMLAATIENPLGMANLLYNGGAFAVGFFDEGNQIDIPASPMDEAGKGVRKLATPLLEQAGAVAKTAKDKMCFVAGTLILTENGLIPIEKIEKGDEVWAYSDSLHIKDKKVVLQTIIRNATQITTIVADTDTIRCTPEHPFYVSNTWVEAGDLVVGDSVFLFDGSDLAIESVWTRDTSCLVYNFEVEGFHTYFVGNGGVLVHNADCGLKPGKNFKSHYVGAKKVLMESFLGKKYPKLKVDNGSEFLNDLSKLIDDGIVKFQGQGTLKKGQDIVNIYRGNGLTLVTKGSNEYVTILKSGEGMDLGIEIIKK